jgi:mono/diheme cytochrome c family protein
MRAGMAATVVALVLAPAAGGAVRVVAPFPLERYAGEGAVGLVVPGAGPVVTRASALNALLTGEVRSSYLGGSRGGEPLIELGAGGPPDTVVVLPPQSASENRPYPIAVTGGGARGVLTSDSTRIRGLVSIADVARDRLRWEPDEHPLATLRRLEDRIERNDRIRMPLTIVLVVAAIAAGLLRPSSGPRVILLALALNLWLAGWWLVALLALPALALPLGAACATIVAAYLLVLGLDPEAVALSPLGPSQAGRFFGVSNLLETTLLVPALLGAALLGRIGAVLAAVAVVAVASDRFGADGGGLLVLLAGYGVLLLRLRSVRLTPARAGVLAAAAVTAGLALVGLDAALGGSSHVTDAIGGGPAELGEDLWDRLRLSWNRTTAGWGPAIGAALGFGGLVWVATRRRRGAVTDALLAALAVSLVVNDTPSDVLGVGSAAAFAVYRWERLASQEPDTLPAMRRATAALVVILGALALVAAGCGGGDEATPTPETVVGTIETETTEGSSELPALDLEGDPAAGKELFASNGCGGCHTLADAGSGGNVGPNLDDAQPDYELVVTRVTEGQGAMPAFGDQLEPQQIADVSQYVVDATSG